MATDLCFFFKDYAPKSLYDLPWSSDVKLIAVEPPASLKCGAQEALGEPLEDPLCSSAYSRMYSWLKDADGRVLPNFLAHYAPGVEPGRIAFVGFSAAHGFLNPLAANDADRADISAYLLLDATFGGGKTGYQAFLRDAAAGERLLVTATSNSGGDTDWRRVMDAVGIAPEPTEARGSMPVASGGVYRIGELGFWYSFVDAKGDTELPHTSMSKLRAPILESYLIPYWSGELGGEGEGGSLWWLWTALGAAGAWIAWKLSKRR